MCSSFHYLIICVSFFRTTASVLTNLMIFGRQCLAIFAISRCMHTILDFKNRNLVYFVLSLRYIHKHRDVCHAILFRNVGRCVVFEHQNTHSLTFAAFFFVYKFQMCMFARLRIYMYIYIADVCTPNTETVAVCFVQIIPFYFSTAAFIF